MNVSFHKRSRCLPGHTPPCRDDLNRRLSQLIAKSCEYPLKSMERQQTMSEIHRLVMKSGKLWKDNSPYYNDALQEMWEYCCQNPEEYDPTLKRVTTWLDDYLKKRLRRYRDAQKRQRQRLLTGLENARGQMVDVTEMLPAPPDIQPTLDIWQITLEWVCTDPDNVLRRTLFRKRFEINAQTLILWRLPPETPWQTVAESFNLTPAEAQDLPKFYHRKCLPLLREFGLSQGYLESLKTSRRRKTHSQMRQAS